MASSVKIWTLGASDVADYRNVGKMCKTKWRIQYGGHMFKIWQNIEIWSKTRCAEPDRPRWGQFAPGRAGLKSGLPPTPVHNEHGNGATHGGHMGGPGGVGGVENSLCGIR